MVHRKRVFGSSRDLEAATLRPAEFDHCSGLGATFPCNSMIVGIKIQTIPPCDGILGGPHERPMVTALEAPYWEDEVALFALAPAGLRHAEPTMILHIRSDEGARLVGITPAQVRSSVCVEAPTIACDRPLAPISDPELFCAYLRETIERDLNPRLETPVLAMVSDATVSFSYPDMDEKAFKDLLEDVALAYGTAGRWTTISIDCGLDGQEARVRIAGGLDCTGRAVVTALVERWRPRAAHYRMNSIGPLALRSSWTRERGLILLNREVSGASALEKASAAARLRAAAGPAFS